jgi:hypothetical protein
VPDGETVSAGALRACGALVSVHGLVALGEVSASRALWAVSLGGVL